MRIGKYNIDNDNGTFVLSEVFVNQDSDSKNYNKEYLKTIGYYSKIEHLIYRMVSQEIILKTEGQNIIKAINDAVDSLKLQITQ